ncbi:SUMF1/EgtB/PvdO family nonheme iron enzyme [Opitutales bacterium]|jgi:hypothetical protein|nr:SUMF1/EgtB/PvdO family nonheme iron enzyme [Opitutales bacterium]
MNDFGRKTRASGSNRVKRGGSWNNTGTNLRSAKRNNNTPGNRNNNLGFRVGFRDGFVDRSVHKKSGNASWSCGSLMEPPNLARE